MSSTPAKTSQPLETKTNWVNHYVGKPWLLGGRGPNAFDCWGVVYHFNKERGIQLPEVPQNAGGTYQSNCVLMQHEVKHALEHNLAHPINTPIDGCTVLLSKNGVFTHAGLYSAAQGGLIVHAVPGTGVVAQPVHTMRARGWTGILYFTHSKELHTNGEVL